MRFVIKREDGRYVARSGSQHSYTKLLQEARTFWTREQAEAERCSNERVVSVDDEMR